MGDYCIVYVVLVLGGWVWYAVCCLKKNIACVLKCIVPLMYL